MVLHNSVMQVKDNMMLHNRMMQVKEKEIKMTRATLFAVFTNIIRVMNSNVRD